MMTNSNLTPAITRQGWSEWNTYKASLERTRINPARDAAVALEAIARNNDLLPDDSPYKITHSTVKAMRDAADCLEKDGSAHHANESRKIASVLEALLQPIADEAETGSPTR